MWKINPGPAVGLCPVENTAVKIAIPATIAINVSRITISNAAVNVRVSDESVFGITESMSKEEKSKKLRKEYSRWNALTNNNDKLVRERAREMTDLAANLRKRYS